MPEWVQICHECNSKKFGNSKWAPTPKTRTCTGCGREVEVWRCCYGPHLPPEVFQLLLFHPVKTFPIISPTVLDKAGRLRSIFKQLTNYIQGIYSRPHL